MPDVPVPFLLPSDGVHFINEVVAGSLINFLDQARSIFVVDGRSESTHKPPTPSCQLPLAVMRLLPPLIVVSALLGGCNTTGSLPPTGSSKPGADEAADPTSTLLLVADPATPLLVALGFPSKPLIVLLDHAERGVGRCGGRCMGRCRRVSPSSRPQRGSTEKEPKNQKEQRTKSEHEKKSRYFFGGPVYGVPFRRYPVSAVPFGRYPVSAVPFGRYPVLAVSFERYRELVLF